MVRAIEGQTHPLRQLMSAEQTIDLRDTALAVHPLGLYRVQPRALLRQVAAYDPHAFFPALQRGSPQLLVKQSRAGAHTPPDRPKSRLRCLIPESQPLTKRSKSSTITSQRRGQCSKRTLITKS